MTINSIDIICFLIICFITNTASVADLLFRKSICSFLSEINCSKFLQTLCMLWPINLFSTIFTIISVCLIKQRYYVSSFPFFLCIRVWRSMFSIYCDFLYTCYNFNVFSDELVNEWFFSYTPPRFFFLR